MKIQVLSDLHLEFGFMHFSPVEDADVLVLAGDIGTMKRSSYLDIVSDWAENYKAVIYVAGNHEFYKADIDTALERINKWANMHENIHFLENGFTVVDGVYFIGGTLWTNFNAHPLAGFHCQTQMNDFEVIRTDLYKRKFTPNDAQLRHDQTVAYLKSVLRISQGYQKVVVTHHAPTFRGILREFDGSLLNYAFASDLEDIIETYEPEIWIHGHMHNSYDIQVHQTRVVCNPRGYVGHALNDDFDKTKVIEI